MPYCDVYRVRKGLFGKSILQQYFNCDAISLPYNTSCWVDVAFENAPAALYNSGFSRAGEHAAEMRSTELDELTRG